MDLGLTDRVVLVAGASRGIGLATAGSALAEGARVLLAARSPEPLAVAADALACPDRVRTCAADLTTAAGIDSALDAAVTAFGRLDVVVANLGDGTGRAGWEHGEDVWQQTFDRNLWPAVRLAEAAVPRLSEGGVIVLVGSITGAERLGPVPYGVAKAAVSAYATRLAATVADRGLRVVCVAPGNILAAGGPWERRLAEAPDEVRQMLDSEVPQRRLAQAREIADVIVFVASARASFMTGTTVVVDGGQTRG